jgi:hypothetical protein
MEKRSCWCGRARHPMTSFSLLDISLIPVPRTIPRQHFLRVLCRATGSVEQPWCCMQAGFLLPCSQHAPASGSFGMCIHILLPASQFCLLTLSLGNQGCYKAAFEPRVVLHRWCGNRAMPFETFQSLSIALRIMPQPS